VISPLSTPARIKSLEQLRRDTGKEGGEVGASNDSMHLIISADSPSGDPLSTLALDRLEEIARDMVSMPANVESWYIVVHEVVLKSSQVEVPHQFRPLRRYRVA
jgi:hypothetical protein